MSPDSLMRPKVFISYSHDSTEHVDRVLELSDSLRAGGVDCALDQYEQSPPEGWPKWMDREIRDADFVLVICTERYYRRVMDEEEPAKGRGVRWESTLAYQHIYNADTKNTKFVPVLFDHDDAQFTPTPLQGATHYCLAVTDAYESLYRRLTNQPRIEKPQLGQVKALPPLSPKRDVFRPPWNVPHGRNPFFSSRDNVLGELWTHLDPADIEVTPRAAGLTGLGGVGKTQVAVEYAYRFRDQYSAVLWVRASTEPTIKQSLLEIAGALGLNQANLSR